MKIMKFGGAALASGEKILSVSRLVKDINTVSPVVLIVSAMQDVTNKLIAIFQNYKVGKINSAHEDVRALYHQHIKVFKAFSLSKNDHKYAQRRLTQLFEQLSFYLTLNNVYSLENYDFVTSFGERLSAHVVSVALKSLLVNACSVDANDVIVASKQFSNAKAFLSLTEKKARKVLLPLVKKQILPVISGFFATAKDGAIVTLGRGGSDYSATILAYALNAKEVILWKAVDGVFSCDPRKNSSAKFFPELTYQQALNLAQKGAKVLHPEAMKPVAMKEIPVWIKNIERPEFIGTKIYGAKKEVESI